MLALQRALRRTISRLPKSFCKRRVDDLSRRVDDLSRCVSTGRKSCEPQENVNAHIAERLPAPADWPPWRLVVAARLSQRFRAEVSFSRARTGGKWRPGT